MTSARPRTRSASTSDTCARSSRRTVSRGASSLSLGSRLSIAAALAVAVAVALGSVASYVAVRAKLRGQVDSALQNRAEVVETVREALAAGQGLPGTAKLIPPGKF